MNNKLIKTYSNQLNIKLIQVEAMRYHFSAIKLAKKEKVNTGLCWQAYDKTDPHKDFSQRAVGQHVTKFQMCVSIVPAFQSQEMIL